MLYRERFIKAIGQILTLSIVFSVGLRAYLAHAESNEIVLVADEWCPYNCVPGGNREGFLVDIACAAFEHRGMKVIYKTMPWSRAIEAARHNEVTGILGAYKEDAPDFIFPRLKLGESGQEFYVPSGTTWRFDGLKSLESISLGVIRDYSYGEELDNYIKRNQGNPRRIQMAAGAEALQTNVTKLFAGRIAVVVEDEAVMNSYLVRAGLDGKVAQVGSLPKEPIYVAFSPSNKRSAEFANILDEEQARLRQSGQLKEIFRKYNVQPVK